MQHRIVKIFTSYIALLVIMMPVAFLLFLQVQQISVRYKMHEKLEYSLLQTISINEKNVQWINLHKEILIENKLFDVKNYKTENGKIILTGLYDQEETFIENFMRDLEADSHSKGKSLVLMKLLQLLQNVFFPQINFSDFFFTFTNSYCEYFHILLHSSFKTILTPPPQQ